MSSIALALAFMISPNDHSVLAQQQNSSNNKTISITMTPNTQQQNPYSMSMRSGLQNQNWTGSISLFRPILDMFKSKVHTTLNGATTNAINSVGGGARSNASAVAAFIHPENGFLVYDVLVLDSSNNIHRVIVDPGNGKVLSNQQMSMMEMMSMMHPSMGMRGMMMGGASMDMMGAQDGVWH
ncbi:MAG: PepSY domain-containing protein [Nitrososphaeraceae archaeon]